MEVKAIIDDAYTRCEALLRSDSDKLTAVAEYLLEHETMDSETFRQFMEGRTPAEDMPEMPTAGE